MNHKELTILFKQTVEKMENLLIAKGHDYSHEEDRLSNFNIAAANIGIKPAIGALYMCGIKITRLSNLIKNNKEPKHESVMDSFIDLINYAFLSYCCYEQNGIEADGIEEAKRNVGNYEHSIGFVYPAYTVKDIDSEFWYKVTVAYRSQSNSKQFCDKVSELIKDHSEKVNSFLKAQPSHNIRSGFGNYKSAEEIAGLKTALALLQEELYIKNKMINDYRDQWDSFSKPSFEVKPTDKPKISVERNTLLKIRHWIDEYYKDQSAGKLEATTLIDTISEAIG